MKPGTVHPLARRVEVMGGTATVAVRPWTMAQRAELKPRLLALAERFLELQENPEQVDLVKLFDHAEDELVEVVRASVEMPEGLTWGELYLEDLPNLVQAVWETSVVRPDGGGIGGKLARALGGALQSVAQRAVQTPKQSKPSSEVSLSSPGAGAPTPSA